MYYRGDILRKMSGTKHPSRIQTHDLLIARYELIHSALTATIKPEDHQPTGVEQPASAHPLNQFGISCI